METILGDGKDSIAEVLSLGTKDLHCSSQQLENAVLQPFPYRFIPGINKHPRIRQLPNQSSYQAALLPPNPERVLLSSYPHPLRPRIQQQHPSPQRP